MPAHVRNADDRRRCQPKSAPDVHGTLIDTVTLDRYGHLFPGFEEQAAVFLDAYLAEAHERAREAEIEACGKTVEKTPPYSTVSSGLERLPAVNLSHAHNRQNACTSRHFPMV